MSMKRISALLLTLALLLALSACGAGESASPEPQAAQGAYRETKLELPSSESGEQGMVGMFVTDEGLCCITTVFSGTEEDYKLSYYRHILQSDGSFVTRDEEWLNVGAPQGGNMMALRRGADGALYMSWGDYDEDLNPVNHILVSRDDGKTGAELTGNALKSCGVIFGIAPLANGGVAVQGEEYPLLILDENGNTLRELEAGNGYGAIASLENRVAVYAPGGKAVRIYDTESGESADWEIALPEGQSQMAFAPDGTLYLAMPTGLYTHAPGGTLWEKLADGDATNLGLPDYYVSNMAVRAGDTDTVYVSDYQTDVFAYAYDAQAGGGVSAELEVFSLRENATVRQAVVDFNRSRGDVRVNYTVAEAMAGGGTQEDYIKALNTQLLAGSGPDILILDGLPLDSYIEKDVLLDVSGIVDAAEPMLPNIRAACETAEGALYAVPLGVELPLSLNRTGNGQAFASLAALTDAAERAGDTPWLTSSAFSYETLSRFLLTYFGEELTAGDEAGIRGFLDLSGRLGAAVGCSDRLGEGMDILDDMPEEEAQAFLREDTFIAQLFAYVDARADSLTLTSRALSDADTMVACAVVDQYGGTLGTLADTFIPTGLVGVNKAGTNQELSAAFLTTLLSAGVQKAADYSTGYPVNLSVLETLFATKTGNMSCGYNLNGGREITGEWPNDARRGELRELLNTVRAPLYGNETLLDMVLPAVTACLDGSATAEEAAAELESVLHTYLSE